MNSMLRNLTAAAIATSLYVPAAFAEGAVSNDAEIPIDRNVVVGETQVHVGGVLILQAEAETTAEGATIATRCRIEGATRDASILSTTVATQDATVPGPLPSDVVLRCPAQLIQGGAVHPLRFRVKGTVFEDGRMTFLLEDVSAE